MSLQPVVAPVILAVVAIALLGLRLLALRGLRCAEGAGRRRAVLRWSALTLAAASLLVAAARPGVAVGGVALGSTAPATAGAPVNVFFVLDRSVDSRVLDHGDGTSRIAGIRTDVAALVDRYPGAQFAVISFSSTATMDWPLSDDVWSLKPFIAGLSAEPIGTPDATYRVDAGAAHAILADHLTRAAEQSPRSTNLVFYLGEGAGGSRAPQSSFQSGAAMPAGGAVFGYGTPGGGPIPQRLVDGQVSYAVDPTGAGLVSALDEPGLRDIARQLGVPYVHRRGGQPIAPDLPQVSAESESRSTDVGVERTVELYWVFALVAAGLVLTEIGSTIWHFRRRRSVRAQAAL